jgi:hypothetical protein
MKNLSLSPRLSSAPSVVAKHISTPNTFKLTKNPSLSQIADEQCVGGLLTYGGTTKINYGFMY